jgi:AcrR family transcriptional regulator
MGEALATVPIVDLPEASYRKLRPGPGMSPDEVAIHQRARIHSALIEIVGERGYGAITVRRLAQLAGVSTRTFYEHFQDKEECFLRTYDLVTQRAAHRVAVSQDGERRWQERLRLAFETFAREVADKPRAARLALVEASAAGPVALERVRLAEGAFESMVEESFSRAPRGGQMPSLLAKGVVSGVSGVTRARLVEGREQELPELAGELLEWTLSLFNDGTAVELKELDRRSPSVSSAIDPEPVTKARENGKCSREDDRPLILTATAKLAAAQSYQQLTVPRIRTAAGVSRRSFDAHFEDVEECFLATLEQRTAIALAHAAKHAEGDGWPEDVFRALRALCAQVASDPILAGLAFVEAFAAGPTVVRCREAMTAVIAERFLGSAPPEQRPNQVAAEASVAAVWGVLHSYVTAGRAQQLPRIAASLSYLALAPAVGAPLALEAIQRAQKQ